ncbi:MAG TPA: 8-amino-7-oxononanoate synthase [Sediminibacterium sp.]|nr:8-amino-7-oxononanoate synthase [Sediminibacterium sp.]
MYRDAFLQNRLRQREDQDALRRLYLPAGQIDFASNDYLGLVKHARLHADASAASGATGSRLLSGNSLLAEELEATIAAFHKAPAALLFNSGYDANLGLLSAVPAKSDTILFDQLSHASLRDGIRLSLAKSLSFAHNDLADLRKKMQHASGTVFIVTESVFSMDGDTCPLKDLVAISEETGAHLIIDEAHATGVIGSAGEGLVQCLGLEEKIFARIHTFGKALGCHGAVVLGSVQLKTYLLNFARSLVYTTALPPHSLSLIRESYRQFPAMQQERTQLSKLAKMVASWEIPYQTLPSETAIQAIIVPGNAYVRQLAAYLQGQGFEIRPILYPTVPKDTERLRLVLHAYNEPEELVHLQKALWQFSKAENRSIG